jgi:ammonium transporter, Amt family
VGGVLGTVALGVFASTAVNPAGADGLLAGNASFFVKEVVAVGVASVVAFGFTYGMLFVINKITPVRVSDEIEATGLDTALHSEQAYELDVVAERKAS